MVRSRRLVAIGPDHCRPELFSPSHLAPVWSERVKGCAHSATGSALRSRMRGSSARYQNYHYATEPKTFS